MPEASQPPRQLLLDLRKNKRSSLPAIDGLTVVNPNPSAECNEAGSALAVFVALDSESPADRSAQQIPRQFVPPRRK